MPRLKLELPSRFDFKTEIPLRIGDINYGGHLGNDSVLALAHEARVQFFSDHGWTELNVDGRSIIMADALVVYKSESFYGDVILIEVAVRDLEGLGCDLVYRFKNKETGKEIARVKTGIVFFDYQARKPVPVPDAFRKAFVGG